MSHPPCCSATCPSARPTRPGRPWRQRRRLRPGPPRRRRSPAAGPMACRHRRSPKRPCPAARPR
ncbi:MAG: hypothetical protein C0505_20310 [Leptothrix sp. (in: Bacteria)]|nr:hypothetical protein [Leptothrix sp. (in: b-proteobacteria)]